MPDRSIWHVFLHVLTLGGDGDEAADPSGDRRSMPGIRTRWQAHAAKRGSGDYERRRTLAGLACGTGAIRTRHRKFAQTP